jgi:hypothetical protein
MAGRGARYIRTIRKADQNQKAITDALKAVGARIFDMSGCGYGAPDICVLKPNKRDVVLIEIKTEKGALKKSQVDAHQEWPVKVVRTIQEALEAIR